MRKRLLAVLVLSGFLASCAEISWYHKEKRMLPGGGRLAKLKAEHTFTFAVIGDTRTGVDKFREQIKEINLLSPDMVIDVGDMIPGYVSDESKIEAMWDEFDKIVSEFTVPLIMVAGNHDIWSPISRKIYERRYGKTYFSFDHKGVHFVVLDSETLGSDGSPINRISDEQIKWLEKDLASHRGARMKFVFLHKPLWQDVHTGKGAGAHWFGNVHPILAKYGVNAVFAGHVHKYVKYPPIDGVHYYITGGGGAELNGKPEEGGFHHYCVIRVKGDRWKMAVIKPGCVCPDDIVKIPAGMVINKEITSVDISDGKGVCVFSVENLSPDKKIKVIVVPIRDLNPHYKMIPSGGRFEVAPRKRYEFQFNLVLDDTKYAFPAPAFVVKIEGLSEEEMKMKVVVPIVVRKCICRKLKGKIVIDGRLDDVGWNGAEVMKDFWTPQADRKARFPTEVRIGYDDKNLYVGFVCYEPKISGIVAKTTKHDGKVWEDDSVEIFLDTNFDRKSYYHFIVNAKGVRYEGIGYSCSWDGKYEVKTSCQAEEWVAEFAIPWKTIGMDSPPKKGTKMGVEFTRSRIQSPSEITQWSPTFGGNHIPKQFGILIIR